MMRYTVSARAVFVTSGTSGILRGASRLWVCPLQLSSPKLVHSSSLIAEASTLSLSHRRSFYTLPLSSPKLLHSSSLIPEASTLIADACPLFLSHAEASILFPLVIQLLLRYRSPLSRYHSLSFPLSIPYPEHFHPYNAHLLSPSSHPLRKINGNDDGY